MELFAGASAAPELRPTAARPVFSIWKVGVLKTPPDLDQFEEDERGECPACGEKKLKPLPAAEDPESVAVCLSCGLLVVPRPDDSSRE
jgi:hypothetical protein